MKEQSLPQQYEGSAVSRDEGSNRFGNSSGTELTGERGGSWSKRRRRNRIVVSYSKRLHQVCIACIIVIVVFELSEARRRAGWCVASSFTIQKIVLLHFYTSCWESPVERCCVQKKTVSAVCGVCCARSRLSSFARRSVFRYYLL